MLATLLPPRYALLHAHMPGMWVSLCDALVGLVCVGIGDLCAACVFVVPCMAICAQPRNMQLLLQEASIPTYIYKIDVQLSLQEAAEKVEREAEVAKADRALRRNATAAARKAAASDRRL